MWSDVISPTDVYPKALLPINFILKTDVFLSFKCVAGRIFQNVNNVPSLIK